VQRHGRAAGHAQGEVPPRGVGLRIG
jgi:hypothetical protein